jgi:hypothetical protein
MGTAIPEAIRAAARRFATATTNAARTTAAKRQMPAAAARAVPQASASVESAVPQTRCAVGNAAPQASASTEPAVPQPRSAGASLGSLGSLGACAVPQARRASTESAVPQASPAMVGGPAARRAKCAAVTGASTSTRPEALLVLLNPRRVDRECRARVRYDTRMERDLPVRNLPRV